MRGCIAFFLFIFIVGPALFTFELAASASTWLFSRDFYSDVLATPEVYSVMLGGLVDTLGANGTAAMSESEFEQLSASVNTEEWRAAVSSSVSQVFDALEGKSDHFTITLPLAPLKALLGSSAGEQFIRLYAQRLEPCVGGQEPTESPDQFTNFPLPVCAPQNLGREAYVSDLVERLPSIMANMPPSMTFSSTIDPTLTGGFVQGTGFGGVSSAVTAVVAVLGVIAVGSWFVTGLIGSGSARGRLFWLGITLVLPSAIVLLLGFGVTAASAALLSDPAAWTLDSNGPISRALYEAIFGGANRISISFLAAGGIPLIAGALLTVFGIIVPGRRDDRLQRDLYNNPTAQFADKPKNDFEVFNKPKNDAKPINDDSIIRPL